VIYSMNSIKVSIIVPCYNQAQYLDKALQSVLEQTYTHWECIIVNDGSLDNTEQVSKNRVAKDSRFVYLEKENGGLSSARNAGLEIVRGEYIQFLDSDDFIDKRKLELSLQQLNSVTNKDIKVVISNFRMFVNTPEKTYDPYCNLNSQLFNFVSLLYQWEESFTIPIHCALFDFSLFKSFRFPEDLKAKEDWVMWVTLFHKGCRTIFINEPLAYYRRNQDSMMMTKDMLFDQLKAYEYFKGILSEEEFHRLSLVLISRYYKSNEELKHKLRVIKESNTYQTGLMIKKILNSIGVLKILRKLFPIILKLKAK
jgi:glycosyltransferase involved in cell wall biosynthesis